MKKDHDKMVPVSVRLTPFQKEWLEVHEQLTGNKVSNVIRTLVDFYIELDAQEEKWYEIRKIGLRNGEIFCRW